MNTARTIRQGITVMAVAALCALIALPAYAAYEDSLRSYWKMDEFNRNDNFSGTSLSDDRWNARDIGGNGALSVSDNLNLSGTFRDIYSKSTLLGDFDIQVDYSNAQFGSNSGTKSIAILAWRDDYQAQIYAVRAKVNADNRYYMQEYNGSTWAYGSNVSTSDTSGKLRLTRVGSTFTGYEWTGSAWAVIPQPASQVTFSGPVYIGAQMNSNNDQISTTFDNFKVNNQSVADAKAANAGTAIGATSVAGKTGFGNALNFNGTSDYVSAGKIDVNSAYTITSWVKRAENGSWDIIVGKRDWVAGVGDTIDYLFAFEETDNLAIIWSSGGSAQYQGVRTTAQITDNDWHLVGVCNPNNSTDMPSLYIDGIAQETSIRNGTGKGAADITSAPTLIGLDDTDLAYNNLFNGSLDDVAFWSRALDTNEMAMLYDLGTEKFEWLTLGVNDPAALNLGYTTSELKLLADLYAGGNTSASELIDGVTWHYLSGDLPGDIGGTTYDYGDTWTYDGRSYIKLGSGLEGNPIPEPASFAGMIFALLLPGMRRAVRGRLGVRCGSEREQVNSK